MYHNKYVFPSYSRLERFADNCVHAAGIVFSVAGSVFLLVAAAQKLHAAADIAGLIVYCIGLMGMFAASAAYNLVSHGGIKEILRRLDHSAIFVMIAGSYTPFAIVVGGAAGGFLLAAVWAIAVIGVTIKLRFPRRFDKLAILLYLAQGWLVVLALEPVAASLPSQALWLLVTGGILYTAGVPFHLMEWMRFHNAIWHLFVLGGAACQFVAIEGAVIGA
ncbi:MAG: PAQR family membrane homeostasis protein TrhA [Rhodomicrobium sp.]